MCVGGSWTVTTCVIVEVVTHVAYDRSAWLQGSSSSMCLPSGWYTSRCCIAVSGNASFHVVSTGSLHTVALHVKFCSNCLWHVCQLQQLCDSTPEIHICTRLACIVSILAHQSLSFDLCKRRAASRSTCFAETELRLKFKTGLSSGLLLMLQRRCSFVWSLQTCFAANLSLSAAEKCCLLLPRW